MLGQQVGLVLVLEVERLHGDEHPGTDLVGRGGRLHDLGVTQHRLDAADAGFHQPLLVLRGVVFGVLTDVAVLPCGFDAFRDRIPTRGGELLQLRAAGQLFLPQPHRKHARSLHWLSDRVASGDQIFGRHERSAA